MRTSIDRALLAAAVLAAALLAAAAPAAGDRFEWSGTVPAGRSVEIKGVNGDLRARAGSGDAVEVVASKHGERDDPAEVRIEVVEHDGGVTVCAVYPGEGNRCAPGTAGKISSHDNDVVVDFEVRVPAGVGFTGRTVNGDIDAEEIDGDVVAHTVNGAIRSHARGHVLAKTVNGPVEAVMGRADWEGDAELATVNGDVTVELPADAAVDLRAKTLNGALESDFPIEISGGRVGRRAKGTLGAGGRGLRVESVNGTIRIRRGA